MHTTDADRLRTTLTVLDDVRNPNVQVDLLERYVLWAAGTKGAYTPSAEELETIAVSYDGPLITDQSLPLKTVVKKKTGITIDNEENSVTWLRELLRLLDNPVYRGAPLPSADMIAAPYGDLVLDHMIGSRSAVDRLRRRVVTEITIESSTLDEPEDARGANALFIAAADPTISKELADFVLDQVRILYTTPEHDYLEHPYLTQRRRELIEAIDTVRPEWRCAEHYQQTPLAPIVDSLLTAGPAPVDTHRFPHAQYEELGIWQTPWAFDDPRTARHYQELLTLADGVTHRRFDSATTMSLLAVLPKLMDRPVTLAALLACPGTTIGLHQVNFTPENTVSALTYRVSNPELDKHLDIMYCDSTAKGGLRSYSDHAHLFTVSVTGNSIDPDLDSVAVSRDPIVGSCMQIVAAMRPLLELLPRRRRAAGGHWTLRYPSNNRDQFGIYVGINPADAVEPDAVFTVDTSAVGTASPAGTVDMRLRAGDDLGFDDLGPHDVDYRNPGISADEFITRLAEQTELYAIAENFTPAHPGDYAYLHWPATFRKRILGCPGRIKELNWCMGCGTRLTRDDRPSNVHGGALAYYHDPVTAVFLGIVCDRCHRDQGENTTHWLPWFTGQAPCSTATWNNETQLIYTGNSGRAPFGTFLYLAGQGTDRAIADPDQRRHRIAQLERRVWAARQHRAEIHGVTVTTDAGALFAYYQPFPGSDRYHVTTR